jgi:hypothetical protein
MSGDPADLVNLRDLALPPPAAWWPPAPGWWVLLAGIAAIGVILLLRALASYRANAYRRAADRELAALQSALDRGAADYGLAAAQVSQVLKRAALVAFPREVVAPLSGAAWLRFLDQTGGTTAFRNGAGRALTEGIFRQSHRNAPAELGPLVAAARLWLRNHRAPATDRR